MGKVVVAAAAALDHRPGGRCRLVLAVAAGAGGGTPPGSALRRLGRPVGRWRPRVACRRAPARCRSDPVSLADPLPARRRRRPVPGLAWSVLAAIGTVESDNGRSTAPGVWSGANGAGAEGPFQFEPATFSAHATVGPGGADPPTPYDPVDAAYTAAALLCADGAGVAGGATGLRDSVFDYNHSTAYADTVLVLSLAFANDRALQARRRQPLPSDRRRPTRDALPLGWHGSRRVRLLGAGPGRLPAGRDRPATRGPGPIRRRASCARQAPPSQPGDLLFFGNGADGSRPRRPLCRTGRDDRRPTHRSGGPPRRRRLAGSGRSDPTRVATDGGARSRAGRT